MSRNYGALVVAASLIVAAVIAFGQDVAAALPDGLRIAVACGVAIALIAWGGATALGELKSRGTLGGFGTVVVGVAVLIGIVLPGAQLIAGNRVSKLAQLGAPIANSDRSVWLAFAISVGCLIAFAIGEFASGLVKRNTRQNRDPARTQFDGKPLYVLLLGVGLLGLSFSLGDVQSEFANRGQVRGGGLISLARTGLALSIALGICKSHWQSKAFATMSAVGVGLLIASGTRTPLLLVASAFGVRFVQRLADTEKRPRALAVAAIVGYVGIVVAVALPQWRSDVASGRPASLAESISVAAANPFQQLGDSGLDTFDGLVLSTKVDREAVDAHWHDPAKALLTFVPYQVWPDKPEALGPTVTHRYLEFGGLAGIFLSAPGYLKIILGGSLQAILSFGVLGFASGIGFRRMPANSIVTALLAYFLLFFFIGGDMFPIFHTLRLMLLLWVCAAAIRAATHMLRSTGFRSVEGPRASQARPA